MFSFRAPERSCRQFYPSTNHLFCFVSPSASSSRLTSPRKPRTSPAADLISTRPFGFCLWWRPAKAFLLKTSTNLKPWRWLIGQRRFWRKSCSKKIWMLVSADLVRFNKIQILSLPIDNTNGVFITEELIRLLN